MMTFKRCNPACKKCLGTGEVEDPGPAIAPYETLVVYPCRCVYYLTETPRFIRYLIAGIILPMLFFYYEATMHSQKWAVLGMAGVGLILMAIIFPTEYCSMKNRHKREWGEMEHRHAKEISEGAAYRAAVEEYFQKKRASE
jgi:hypothetical protein